MTNKNLMLFVFAFLAIFAASAMATCVPGAPPVSQGFLPGCPVNSVCEYYCQGIPGGNYTKGECKKEGTRFKKCVDKNDLEDFYSERQQDESTPKISALTTNEPVSPFKSLPTYRFTELRRAIEQKNDSKFEELLEENPRFLVNTNNDLPTIVQEGFRYNTLHVACRSSNLYVAQRVLSLITNIEWLNKAYGTDCGVMERSNYLLDALLNTPDLVENNLPLHYACKFGEPDIVALLLSHSVCKKKQKNKYNESPLDMLCRGFKGTAKEKEEKEKKILTSFGKLRTPSPGRSAQSPFMSKALRTKLVFDEPMEEDKSDTSSLYEDAVDQRGNSEGASSSRCNIL
uniref:Uncharacterized protein n=1 Tax=Ditylenchus dipsaci TaxID=166011 RepID=A0A915CV95_9BILA